MLKDNQINPCCKRTVVFALLFIFAFLIYSNTFQFSWHFDDKPNIVNNYHLHLKDLRPKSLIQAFFTNPSNPWETADKMYRPVACLTFALNWYFGKDNVVGYHIVNIIIHILTAFILYITILNLFRSPNLKNKFKGSEHFIALLTAVLWAVNPIQTQAVTYIVQRMTALVAMFYVLGLYFYIKGRISHVLQNRIIFFIFCAFSFVLALGSKENAATFPLALILVEIIFFQDLSLPETRKKFIFISAVASLTVIFVGTMLFMKGDMFSFLKGYANRPFSFAERLMTEPRIVIYYLSQIFYPVPNRLSIEHDVIISTSILNPWTTLPAILIIILLTGIGFSLIKKRPVIAFAILFFFLNHIIESSIMPLELVFEHRNYLPSLFLFFPVSIGIKQLIDHYRAKTFLMYIIMISFVTLLIIGLGTSTYIRNRAWATEKSLWEDAMHKAPNSARPLTNLAWQISRGSDLRTGKYDLALKLYEKSLSLQKTRKNTSLSILNSMAGIYSRKDEQQRAIDLLKKSLILNSDYKKSRFDLVQIMIIRGRWDEASEHADILVSKKDAHEGYLNIKGFILLKQKKSDEAIKYFQKSLKIAPNFKTTLMYMGSALSLSGYYSRADWFLRRANKIPPDDLMTLFCLIENSVKAGNMPNARRYTEKLLDSLNIIAVKDQLKRLLHDNLMLSVSRELLTEIISKELMKRSKEISELINSESMPVN